MGKPSSTVKIPPLAAASQVSSLVNLAARLMNQAARVRMGELGAWPAQIPIILWLLEDDGIIQKDLVARVGIEQSTLAEHLERMERDGLIIRKRGSDDRRKYRIHLTERARAMSEDLLVELKNGTRIFTKGIKKADLDVFDLVIRRVIQNVEVFLEEKSDVAIPLRQDAIAASATKPTRKKKAP